MVDVKYWGPSGWKLLHTLSFEEGHLSEKKKLFSVLADVLPCKYCRMSTKQFVKEMPVTDDTALWLYNLHNRVNKKLHDQHVEDPKIPEPAPAPTFDEVSRRFRSGNPGQGKEFLYAVAFNFDKKKHVVSSHRKFWEALSAVYPELKVPSLISNRKYLDDVREMLGDKRMPSQVYTSVKTHKSACVKKTFKGKTCRKKFK
jgi:hypothetical protein